MHNAKIQKRLKIQRGRKRPTKKYKERQKESKVEAALEDQFAAGRVLASISSRPGQCRRRRQGQGARVLLEEDQIQEGQISCAMPGDLSSWGGGQGPPNPATTTLPPPPPPAIPAPEAPRLPAANLEAVPSVGLSEALMLALVVGAVVGGLLLVICVGCWRLRHRPRRRRRRAQDLEAAANEPEVTEAAPEEEAGREAAKEETNGEVKPDEANETSEAITDSEKKAKVSTKDKIKKRAPRAPAKKKPRRRAKKADDADDSKNETMENGDDKSEADINADLETILNTVVDVAGRMAYRPSAPPARTQ